MIIIAKKLKSKPKLEEKIPQPFSFRTFKEEYDLSDKELGLIMIEVCDSNEHEMAGLIQEQIDNAKGFLEVETAMFIIASKLGRTQNQFHAAAEKLRESEPEKVAPKKKAPAKKKAPKKKPPVKKAPKKKAPTKKPSLPKKVKETKIEIGPDDDEELDDLRNKTLKMEIEKLRSKTLKKKKTLKKPVIKTQNEGTEPTSHEYKRSFLVVINGGEGTGKTVAAALFPRPFLLDLEYKIPDLLEYPPEIFPEIAEWEEGEDYAIGIAFDNETGEDDKVQTRKNIQYWLNWFKTEGYKNRDTLIIDVGKEMWDAAWGAEEEIKGRALGQVEYIPITKAEKKQLVPMIHFCRTHGKNLVIITHWGGVYVERRDPRTGYPTNVKIREEPDIKDWIRDLMGWRVDLLKPQQSGFEGRFIADFQKAPGSQYFKIDITDQSLYEIISNPKRLAEGKENYRKLLRKREIEIKKAEKEKK